MQNPESEATTKDRKRKLRTEPSDRCKLSMRVRLFPLADLCFEGRPPLPPESIVLESLRS